LPLSRRFHLLLRRLWLGLLLLCCLLLHCLLL